jgi:hypothetical protein
MSEHVRKQIEEAFTRAREQGPTTAPKQPAQDCDLSTTQPLRHYTEADSHQFHRRADVLIKAAAHSPHVKLHRHRANSHYVGDLDKPQPRAEELFAEAVKHYVETEAPKKKERKKASGV